MKEFKESFLMFLVSELYATVPIDDLIKRIVKRRTMDSENAKNFLSKFFPIWEQIKDGVAFEDIRNSFSFSGELILTTVPPWNQEIKFYIDNSFLDEVFTVVTNFNRRINAAPSSLENTFVYDRSLYGGGATFAEFITPLFDSFGEARYNYSTCDFDSVRKCFFDEIRNDNFRTSYDETNIDFLYGISLHSRMSNWPKPIKYIAVLRDPALRFISIVRSISEWTQWNSFWEINLWRGDCNFENIECFIESYAKLRPEWCRSQFTELLSNVDYAGLEWYIDPGVYPDDNDPLQQEDGIEKTIKAMEERFSEIYILELQEESAYHFAIKYGFTSSLLEPKQIVRHEFYKAWQESDIDTRIFDKILNLVEREMYVYNYFRNKFEQSFKTLFHGKDLTEYFDLKKASLAKNPKLRTHTRFLPQFISSNSNMKNEMISQ